MNLEELKSAWQVYDQKLQSSQVLNNRIVMSMIRERSQSRVSKIRKENAFFLIVMLLELGLLGAIFIGNPFDFRYAVQYVPYGFLAVGIVMALVTIFKSYQMLDVDINNANLKIFLKKVVDEYEKSKKIEKWFGIIIFASGCLTVLSFLPTKIDKKGLMPAIVDTLIPMGICLVIYFVAFRLGAFKNRKSDHFKADLKELEELRALSSDLKEH